MQIETRTDPTCPLCHLARHRLNRAPGLRRTDGRQRPKAPRRPYQADPQAPPVAVP